jgi:hypothetical protein
MASNTLEDRFGQAKDKFKDKIGRKKFEEFRTITSKSLKAEILGIQKAQQDSATLRNLGRIKHFIRAFEQFGNVVEVFLNVNEVVCFVWGPMKFLITIAKNLTDTFEIILDAWEQIGEQLPLLEDIQHVFKDNNSLQEILVKIFTDVLEFHQHAISFYKGRGLKAVMKSLWKSFSPQFESILTRLRFHKQLLMDKIAIINSQKLNQHVSGHIEDYKLIIQDIRDYLHQYEQDKINFAKSEQDRADDQYDKVKNWISAGDIESKHHDIGADLEKHPGSGDWILEAEDVKNWLYSETSDDLHSSLLCITGRPGAGKTYLAHIIIEACRKRAIITNQPQGHGYTGSPDDAQWLTGYYYCSQETRTKATDILKGIISQLVTLHRELVPYCLDKKNYSSSTNLASFQLAKDILTQYCERIPRLYIVIDGLDECPPADVKPILETFTKLVENCDKYARGKLRVLFISQPLPEIDKIVSSAAVMNLTSENNKDDIRSYCKRRVGEFQAKFQLTEEDQRHTIDLTCARADGMFLFATLVMNNLSKQIHRRGFNTEMAPGRFPANLDAAYHRIVERIKQDLGNSIQYDHVESLLGWLVRSKRPLKWSEIQAALMVDLDDDTSNELSMDLKLCDEPATLCGSLVQVLPGDRIELVHSTARTYLCRQNLIRIDVVEADLNRRCLRYLTLKIFRPDTEKKQLVAYARRGEFDFQDYAIGNWFMHIQTIIEEKHNFFPVELESGQTVPLDPEIFATELLNFISFYPESFPADDILDQVKQDCEYFRNLPFYDSILRVWNHICIQKNKNTPSRNKVSIEALEKAMTRNRKIIEDLSTKPSGPNDKRDPHPFKCTWVFCHYFHFGISDAKKREEHINRHNRPFHCDIDTCTSSELGFASEKQLETHRKTFHPEKCDLSETFAQLNRKKTSTAKWECNECHRTFTRGIALKSHHLNHKGLKPHACPECGKAFTRVNDMRRHEEIHKRWR